MVLTLLGDVECVFGAGSGRLGHEEHLVLHERDVHALLLLDARGPVMFHRTGGELQEVVGIVAEPGFHRVHDHDVLAARHVDLRDAEIRCI